MRLLLMAGVLSWSFSVFADLKPRWEPWVGKRYEETRLLIIGESHYYNQEMSDSEMSEWLNDRGYTIQTVREYPMLGLESGWINRAGRKSNSTWDNIFRVLCGSDLLDAPKEARQAVVERFAFMNIVHRPMDYTNGSREQPKADDFRHGWRVFFCEILPRLKPRAVLCVGITASKTFEEIARECGFDVEKTREASKIDRVAPIRAKIAKVDCEVVFMRHTGMFFSWRKWREYIETHTGIDLKPFSLKQQP